MTLPSGARDRQESGEVFFDIFFQKIILHDLKINDYYFHFRGMFFFIIIQIQQQQHHGK